ncbi:unnamed protein product [Caenorhabditis auriculariae]|uniref:Uncharacterized protein n=1 Tax=Caenorhabditis auriculariae TaxID=2777116 RepID=A0A8S1H6E3_9PELO|nr:unnamed protein product [Caenorhabditis auriculariae]
MCLTAIQNASEVMKALAGDVIPCYYAEYCSVEPRDVNEKCSFSPNVCYEDSCCMSFETAISWHYRAAQSVHIGFSAAGVIASLVFVSIMIITLIVHSMDMIVMHVIHLQQSYVANASDPCKIRNRVDFCAPYRNTYSLCLFLLAVIQYSLYIDRLIGVFWRKYNSYSNYVLAVLLVQATITPVVAVRWVYRDANPSATLLSCINVPLDSIVDMSMLTAFLLPINFICFFLSLYLFSSYKKTQRRSRFDIHRHFLAVIDVDSSEFLRRTTATQAFMTVVYPVAILVVRYTYEYVTRPIHLTLATSAYIFSFMSFLVPLVMIYSVQKYQFMRKQKIFDHLSLKSVGSEGSDNYFNGLKEQWGGPPVKTKK